MRQPVWFCVLLNVIVATVGCGWLSETYRDFVGFPHLDMAYRLIEEEKFGQARLEFEYYLERKPEDDAALMAYMELLRLQGDFPYCEEVSSRILEREPEHLEARLIRANARAEMGKSSDAISDYLAAAASPEITAQQRHLAWVATAELLEGAGRMEEARHILALVANQSGAWQDLARLAVLERTLGNGDSAIEVFRRSLSKVQTEPDRLLLLVELAETAASVGQEDLAIVTLEEAIRLSPDTPSILKKIAVLLEQLDRPGEAVRWARRCVELESTAEARRYLVGLLAKAGRYREIEDEMEAWLRSSMPAEERASLLELRARQLESSGDASAAAVQYGEAYRLERKFPTLLAKAIAHEKAGELEAAVDCYLTAVSIREIGDYHYRLGILYRSMGDNVRAFHHFTSALTRGLPRVLLAETYENLGYLYQANSRNREAIEAFGRAKNIRNPEAEVVLAHADSLHLVGQTNEAIRMIEDQIVLEETPQQHLRLADWYAATGETNRAIESLERALELGLSSPGLELAKKELGYLYISAGRRDDALNILFALLDSGSESSDIWSSMGYQFYVDGDFQFAEYCFERSLSLERDLAVALAFSQTINHLGQQEKANRVLWQYEPLARNDSGVLGARFYLELGESDLQLERLQAAVRSFSEAYERSGRVDWDPLSRAFHASFQAGDWSSAERFGRRLVEMQGVPQRQLATSWKTLGLTYSELGQPKEAVAAFERAVQLGLDASSVRVPLALQFFNLDRFDLALVYLQQAYEQKPSWEIAQYLARTYERLQKPGLSVHFLRVALADPELEDDSVRRNLWKDRGFLAALQSNYAEAAQAFGMAVLLEEDPELRVKLVQMLVRDGRFTEAERQLAAIDLDALSEEARADLVDQRAAIASGRGMRADALKYRLEGLRLEPTAERAHSVGGLLVEGDRNREAISYFEDAVRRAPSSAAYLAALGYALYRDGRTIEAAEKLQAAVEIEPDYLQLYKDLGYVYLKTSNNEKSAEWFVRAIDAQRKGMAVLPGEIPLKQRNVALREEVGRIRDWMDIWTYLSYRSREKDVFSPAFVPGAGAIPSQGGFEFAIRPPGIGLRNQRVLQFFGRVLWDLYPGSFRFDSSSYQGSLGVRYKPFTTQNLVVGVEKLFRMGSNAVNSFLLRTLYSWSPSAVRHPALLSRSYTLSYLDAAYSVQTPSYLSFYGEMRQGVNLKLTDSLVLSPHVVADLRYLNHEVPWNSYYEIGGGASLRYFFNENEYETYRSDLELLLQYKRGRFWNDSHSSEREPFGGVTFSMLFHF